MFKKKSNAMTKVETLYVNLGVPAKRMRDYKTELQRYIRFICNVRQSSITILLQQVQNELKGLVITMITCRYVFNGQLGRY